MFFTPKTITTLEIEMSSYCNAFCGACHRNIEGGPLANGISLFHMSKNVWQKLISTENLEHIDLINLDGNIGDASMHPKLIDFLQDLYEIKKNIHIRISTNGGARSPQFWEDLAGVLTKFESHRVTFSIDGLADTNHLYRRGVIWDKLMKNLKSFNRAGGISRWRCVVFDFNKNHIDEIAKIAEEMGCSTFVTFRNRLPSIIQRKYRTFDANTLTSPSSVDFEKNFKRSLFFKKISKSSYSTKIHIEEPYSCPFAEEGKVTIDNAGYVWPCCFTSIVTTEARFPLGKYKKRNFIVNSSLSEILGFFREDLFKSWDAKDYPVCEECFHKISPPTYSILKK